MIPSMSSSLNHSWIISNIKGDHLLCGGSRYQAKAPAGFGESLGGGQQTGQQRDQGDADEGNAAARHELFHTQIGVGNRLDGGRRRVKKYLWSFFRTAPAGQVRL